MYWLQADILSYCLEALVLSGLRAGWGPPAAYWVLAWVLHALAGVAAVRSWSRAAPRAGPLPGSSGVTVRTAVATPAILVAAGCMGAAPLGRWLPCPAELYTLARLDHVGKVRLRGSG